MFTSTLRRILITGVSVFLLSILLHLYIGDRSNVFAFELCHFSSSPTCSSALAPVRGMCIFSNNSDGSPTCDDGYNAGMDAFIIGAGAMCGDGKPLCSRSENSGCCLGNSEPPPACGDECRVSADCGDGLSCADQLHCRQGDEYASQCSSVDDTCGPDDWPCYKVCWGGGCGGGAGPNYVTVRGRITDSQDGDPIADVLVEVGSGDAFAISSTDSNGWFEVGGIVEEDRSYHVRPLMNFTDPRGAPPGYKTHIHPSNNTNSWIDCNNENRHVPWNALAYECQNENRGDDCNENDACHFQVDPLSPPYANLYGYINGTDFVAGGSTIDVPVSTPIDFYGESISLTSTIARTNLRYCTSLQDCDDSTTSTQVDFENDDLIMRTVTFDTKGTYRVLVNAGDTDGLWCVGYTTSADGFEYCGRDNDPRDDHIIVNVVNIPPTGTITGQIDGAGFVYVGGSTIDINTGDSITFTGNGFDIDGVVIRTNLRYCTSVQTCNSAATSTWMAAQNAVSVTKAQVFNTVGTYRVLINARDNDLDWCVGYLGGVLPFCDRVPPREDDFLIVSVTEPRYNISGDIGVVDPADNCTVDPDTGAFDPLGTLDITWIRDLLLGSGSDLGVLTSYSILNVLGGSGWFNSLPQSAPHAGGIGNYKLMCIDGQATAVGGIRVNDLATDLGADATNNIVADIGYEYIPHEEAWIQTFDGDLYATGMNINPADSLGEVIATYNGNDFDTTAFGAGFAADSDEIAEDNQYIRNYGFGFWPQSFEYEAPPWTAEITSKEAFTGGDNQIEPGGVYTITSTNLNNYIKEGTDGFGSFVYDLVGDPPNSPTGAWIAVIYVMQGSHNTFVVTNPIISSHPNERILFISELPVEIYYQLEGSAAIPDIQAAIISKGDITFNANPSAFDAQIFVEGPLIAGNGNEAGVADVIIGRYMGEKNSTVPVVSVLYNPKYLFGIDENSGLMMSDVTWVVE